MIEFKGVTKKYDNVIALNNLNLVIPAGKIFGFLATDRINMLAKRPLMSVCTIF